MNATVEGVVLIPSAFSITLGVWPSIMATQELVVPRSIPIMASLFPVEKKCFSLKRLPLVARNLVNIVRSDYNRSWP